MSLLTPEELILLEKNPDTAAVAKKLKEENWIPKSRYDEVFGKQKELSEKLTLLEAEKLTSAQKTQEVETQLKAEKTIADYHRQYVKEKKSQFKEQLGSLWLPEYESDSFSITSIEKIAGQVLKGNPPGTVITPPGKQPAPKRLSDMTPAERESTIAKAKNQ